MLSGMYTPLLLGLGVVSCVGVALLCERLGLLDTSHENLRFGARSILRFFPWLLWQIIKSNLDVSRRVWTPRMPVGPCVVTIPANQKPLLGLAVHANAITLTPGTLSVYAEPGRIEVHALSRDIADDLASGEFDRRVSRLEGSGGDG